LEYGLQRRGFYGEFELDEAFYMIEKYDFEQKRAIEEAKKRQKGR